MLRYNDCPRTPLTRQKRRIAMTGSTKHSEEKTFSPWKQQSPIVRHEASLKGLPNDQGE